MGITPREVNPKSGESRNVSPRQAPAQPRATPGASQPPGSASAVRAGPAPLQVLYWRPDAPLPLDLGPFGGQSIVTTLVIQEVYLGGPTQDRPVGATNEVLSAEC